MKTAKIIYSSANRIDPIPPCSGSLMEIQITTPMRPRSMNLPRGFGFSLQRYANGPVCACLGPSGSSDI